MSNRKDISKVFKETIDTWPRVSYRGEKIPRLSDALQELEPNKKEVDVNLDLAEENFDLTEECLGIEKQFRPDLKIRTHELFRESSRHKITAGVFFRVIGDATEKELAKRLCIQYIITWTKQLPPNRIFSLLVLQFLSATLFSLAFFFRYPISLVESHMIQAFWSLISLTIFTIWIFLVNLMIKLLTKTKMSIPATLMPFSSLLIYGLAQEYWNLTKKSVFIFNWRLPKALWLSIILLFLSIVIFVLFNIRRKICIIEKFTHKMDYAPIFLYLIKDDNDQWDLEGVHFDRLHYSTDFIPKGKCSFRNEENVKLRFTITNEWHSIVVQRSEEDEFYRNIPMYPTIKWISRFIVSLNKKRKSIFPRVSKFLDSLFLHPLAFNFLLIVLFGVIILFIFIFPTFDMKPSILVVFAGIILIFYIFFFNYGNELTKYVLDIWYDLYGPNKDDIMTYHHLSEDKLRVLWNLRDPKLIIPDKEHQWIEDDHARFIIRVKMQYPFVNYRHWTTFRDTPEELLSIISLFRSKTSIKDKEL